MEAKQSEYQDIVSVHSCFLLTASFLNSCLSAWQATAIGDVIIPPSVKTYTWTISVTGVVMVGVAPERVDQTEGDGSWSGWYVYLAGGSKYSYSVINAPIDGWTLGKQLPDTVTLTLNQSKLYVSVDSTYHLVFDNVPRHENLRLACKLKGKGSSAKIQSSAR